MQTSPTDAEIAAGLLQTEDVSDDDNSVDVDLNQWSVPIEISGYKLSRHCEESHYLQTRGILSSLIQTILEAKLTDNLRKKRKQITIRDI